MAGTVTLMMMMITVLMVVMVFVVVMVTRSYQETTRRAASMIVVIEGTAYTRPLLFKLFKFLLSQSAPLYFKRSEIYQY